MSEAGTTLRLRHALARAGAYGVQTERSMRLKAPEQALHFVSAQIAATLLSRQLEFRVDGTARLRCIASGARLLRFSEIPDIGGSAAEHDLTDLEDRDKTGETLALLRDLVVRICIDASLITVDAHPVPDLSDPAHGGASVEAIISGFRLPSGDIDLARFAEDATTHLKAAAILDGDLLYPLFGEDADTDLLSEMVENGSADAVMFPDEKHPPSGALLLTHRDDISPGFLLARLGGHSLVALTRAQSEPGLLDLWYATRNGM